MKMVDTQKLTNTMKFFAALTLLISCSEAFMPIVLRQPTLRVLLAEAEESKESVANIVSSPYEAGSHDELMYCLGVNLARQLGDIRPLVENGEELATVAKGLLDTVIGRLTDDGQRSLLATRGKDLNQLIADRA